MQRNCDTDNPLVRDGISQAQRLLSALDPNHESFFNVDERSIADLICLAQRYAGRLQYYDAENRPSGDWMSFLENDVATVIALISKKDVSSIKACFDAILPTLNAMVDFESPLEASDETNAVAVALLFDLIFTLAGTINEWYETAVEGLTVHDALYRIVTAQLKEQLEAALLHYESAKKIDGFPVEDPSAVPADCTADIRSTAEVLSRPFQRAWLPNPESTWSDYLQAAADKAALLSGYGIFDDIDTARTQLIAIYETFYNAVLQLRNDAPAYLQETLDKWPYHEAHMGLFLAFLQLFQTAQRQLNEITGRHLDFYYQKVLQFSEKPEVSDRVHLVFELAKQVDTHLLEAGTVLKAGKDSQGNDVHYQLDQDIVFNRAAVSQLKTVFIDRQGANGTDRGDHDRVYAAPVANSRDGRGAEFEVDEPSWKAFGESQKIIGGYRAEDEMTMQTAEIGFALTSPVLVLGEGARTITISLTADEDLPDTIPLGEAGRMAYRVELSGEEGWIKGVPESVEKSAPNELTFTVFVDETIGPVVAYDSEIHGGHYDTFAPILAVILAHQLPGPPQYAYHSLKNVVITNVRLQVAVDKVRNLIVQNDLGLLDVGKPFQPFGPIPVKGARFYIGSDEVFRKRVTDFTLYFEWLDAPANFADHYQEYNQFGVDKDFNNAVFTAELSVLKDRSWDPLIDKFRLFANAPYDAAGNPIINQLSPPTSDPITPDAPGLDPITQFNPNSQQGFIRWELIDPPQAFGHQIFAKVYAKQVIALTQAGSGGNSNGKDAQSGSSQLKSIVEGAAAGDGKQAEAIDALAPQAPAPPELPNEPYTPVIRSLYLDYTATADVDLTFDSTAPDRLLHIYPFGYKPVPSLENEILHLLPRFENTTRGNSEENNGELYIGLTDLAPPQNLVLLLQVAEGSADPELPKQTVNWSYLSGNHWQAFAPNEILSDTSNGLLTSGIIRFAVPREAAAQNSILPADLHWLRASVAANPNAVCNLIEIKAQAAQASFVSQGNAPDFLARSLPADTISKLKVKQAAVKTISQPYASFGGRIKEERDQFYRRVSERLRHKGRGITIFDYEKLVLEQFPEIYKARCINHSTYIYRGAEETMLQCVHHQPLYTEDLRVDRSEFAPGFVSLILIPDLNNKNAVNPLEPRVSLNVLETVRQFLCRRISPFAARHLKVLNPLYEKVQVDFGVEFRTGYDRGFYEKKLHQDIIQFLSPWAFERGQDIVFGGRLHKSVILNFVEERPYVDYVTDFKMNHFTSEPQPRVDVDEAVPVSARSIIVSHSDHFIKPAKNGP